MVWVRLLHIEESPLEKKEIKVVRTVTSREEEGKGVGVGSLKLSIVPYSLHGYLFSA